MFMCYCLCVHDACVYDDFVHISEKFLFRSPTGRHNLPAGDDACI